MRYGTTELYRIYVDGVLMYVGISHNYWKQRRLDHGRVYGKEAAEAAQIETFATRSEAEIAELRAQFHERPMHGKYPQSLDELEHAIALIKRRYASRGGDVTSVELSAITTNVVSASLGGESDFEFIARIRPWMEKHLWTI